MSECNHEQCALCLRRKCRPNVTNLKKFGEVWACEQCVYSAVHWAYTCATKWGGDYGRDICGKEESIGGGMSKDEINRIETLAASWRKA